MLTYHDVIFGVENRISYKEYMEIKLVLLYIDTFSKTKTVTEE